VRPDNQRHGPTTDSYNLAICEILPA